MANTSQDISIQAGFFSRYVTTFLEFFYQENESYMKSQLRNSSHLEIYWNKGFHIKTAYSSLKYKKKTYPDNYHRPPTPINSCSLTFRAISPPLPSHI